MVERLRVGPSEYTVRDADGNVVYQQTPDGVFVAEDGKSVKCYGEVMRITRDRIWVDPDVAVDEAARHVLNAVQEYLGTMLRQARAEALREAAELLKRGEAPAVYLELRRMADEVENAI